MLSMMNEAAKMMLMKPPVLPPKPVGDIPLDIQKVRPNIMAPNLAPPEQAGFPTLPQELKPYITAPSEEPPALTGFPDLYEKPQSYIAEAAGNLNKPTMPNPTPQPTEGKVITEIPKDYLDAYNFGKQFKGVDLNELSYGQHGKETADKLSDLMNNHDTATLFEIGHSGKDFPEHVVGWRFGKIPEKGQSTNFRDNKYEKGISLMALEGESPTDSAKMYQVFNAKNKNQVRVSGFLVGYGADGEPLVLGAKELPPKLSTPHRR